MGGPGSGKRSQAVSCKNFTSCCPNLPRQQPVNSGIFPVILVGQSLAGPRCLHAEPAQHVVRETEPLTFLLFRAAAATDVEGSDVHLAPPFPVQQQKTSFCPVKSKVHAQTARYLPAGWPAFSALNAATISLSQLISSGTNCFWCSEPTFRAQKRPGDEYSAMTCPGRTM